MYLIEWGAWKGRLMPQTEAEKKENKKKKKASARDEVDFENLSAQTGGIDKPTGVEPNDAYAIYAYNDRYIDVRGAPQEEKRGLITFLFLFLVWFDSFMFFFAVLNPLVAIVTGEGLNGVEYSDGLGLFVIFCSTLLIIFNYFILKFFRYAIRLELFTQRQIIVRFNRITRQVHINRPKYAGGIITLPWEVTAAEANPDLPDEHMIGMPLMLAWPSEVNGAGFDEFAMLGEPMDGTRTVVGLWEFIRRYMQEGPQAVPKPKRLRPLWASPVLSLREVVSFLMPMVGRGGGVFSLVWGIVLLPVMVLHFVCHWLSMLLCYRVRWPKVIEEAGLPGKPVPKMTVAEDYGPEIGARLREATLETRGVASQPAQKDAGATFQG